MTLDYVDLRPDLMVEMVMRYRDLESTLPFNGCVNNSDHGGVHSQGLRIRMRHVLAARTPVARI